jgi:hypothetical protein
LVGLNPKEKKMKTAGVKALVREVLDTMPAPYSEHVTDDVLFAIESTPAWRRRYDALCDHLGKSVVNAWSGQWIGHALGKVGEKSVPSRKNTLSETYSLLDADAPITLRLPTEQEARETMAAYYRENKKDLPASIREHREEIIALLMEGMPANRAFLLVLGQTSSGQRDACTR